MAPARPGPPGSIPLGSFVAKLHRTPPLPFVLCREMQRRPAAAVPRIEICCLFEQLAHYAGLARVLI